MPSQAIVTPRRVPRFRNWFLIGITLVPGWGSIADANDPPDSPFRTVVRRRGDDGVAGYRIPGLATTPKGTLLAVFDVRYRSLGDLPADIDVGLMRSSDDGQTWGPLQVILNFDQSEPGSRGNGVGDPAILVDPRTGQILVIALWSRGDHAWTGSGPGFEPDQTGQLVLTRSLDDGATWSRPVNLTRQIAGRDPRWRLCFDGPGRGIALRDGTLVYAAQLRDQAGTPHSALLFSGNGGDDWAISRAAISDQPPTSEAQVVERDDGSLLLTMRSEAHDGQRVWASFTRGDSPGQGTWSKPWFTRSDPTCMAGLIRHPDGLLFLSHPESPTKRVALTVHASRDGGESWPWSRLLDPRPCAYSCMTVLRDGRIGILYETGDGKADETLTFARFATGWVAGDRGIPRSERAGIGESIPKIQARSTRKIAESSQANG